MRLAIRRDKSSEADDDLLRILDSLEVSDGVYRPNFGASPLGEWWRDVRVISRYRHRNGFCLDCRFPESRCRAGYVLLDDCGPKPNSIAGSRMGQAFAAE